MHYDAIVIGTGGVGSAALMHLASRGARVLGLDRYPPAHDQGSSHGETRMIRQAYFEHAAYVPLILRAYELWAELEQRVGRRLYHETGVVEIGPPTGLVVPGVLSAARDHNLQVDTLTPREVEQRWPGFRVSEDFVAVYEPRSGYLRVEDCVRAHLECAQACGARLETGTAVDGWSADAQSVRVHVGSQTFTADKLVIAAGAWAGQLIADLGVPLEVRRKPQFWYECHDPRYRETSGCPAFLWELPHGVFYGFPQIDAGSLKLAEHSGGRVVADPSLVDPAIDFVEQARIEQFLAAHLPGVTHRLAKHVVCKYTMSPDANFLVDFHPYFRHVVYAAGLSGHGFKFTSVLGEVLADFVLTGSTTQPVDFLAARRFTH